MATIQEAKQQMLDKVFEGNDGAVHFATAYKLLCEAEQNAEYQKFQLEREREGWKQPETLREQVERETAV